MPQRQGSAASIEHNAVNGASVVKEVSFMTVVLRSLGRFAAGSGVLALLIWLTWVMLDLKHLQSGFTLP